MQAYQTQGFKVFRKKKRAKTVSKKNKGDKTDKDKKSDGAGGEGDDEILASFAEGYRPIIRALPRSLWPTSTRHGEHLTLCSSTTYLEQ